MIGSALKLANFRKINAWLQKDFLQMEALLGIFTCRSFHATASYSQGNQVLGTDRDSISFRTGPASAGIPADNVAYSYPAVGMQSFYRYEKADRQGYIQLKVGQRDLLSFGQPLIARFEGGGNRTEVLATYNDYDKRLGFDIPVESIQPASAYTLSIVLEGKVLLSIPFRSSRYDYFKDKMAAFATTATASWQDWNQQFSAPTSEPFDDAEALGRQGETALIGFEMITDGYTWYSNNLSKLYGSGAFPSMRSFSPVSRDVAILGTKGERALRFSTGTTLENKLHTVLLQDFADFKKQAELQEAQRLQTCGSNTTSRGCTVDVGLNLFIRQSIPRPGAGAIPVMASYRLPGSSAVNSTCSFVLIFGSANQN
jgi:hypothetical protein